MEHFQAQTVYWRNREVLDVNVMLLRLGRFGLLQLPCILISHVEPKVLDHIQVSLCDRSSVLGSFFESPTVVEFSFR